MVENDEKYIEKVKELIFNWIDSNEITLKGGNTIRTIIIWYKSISLGSDINSPN